MLEQQIALNRLKNSSWLFDSKTQQIFALLDGEAKATMAVGGIVRDSLLGRENTKTDVDFATELFPDEVIKRAKKANIAFYPTGIEHGTVTLRIENKSFEITTLRQDVTTDGRHAKVQFGTDWLMDAKRRDFTFNALYVAMNGELFDPLSGLKDCLNNRVRFIGNADRRINEDRLRVYRFFRFCASHGEQDFDIQGLAACNRVSSELGNISHERIGAEMMRMLALKLVAKTLDKMSELDIFLLEKTILEQLYYYENLIQKPKDIVRLAIIAEQYDSAKLQNIWRLSNVKIKQVRNLIKGAKMFENNQLNAIAYHYGDVAKDIIILAGIKNKYSKLYLKQLISDLQLIRVPAFPISGIDIINLGVRPSKQIGETIKQLEAKWINSDFKLTKKQLLSEIKWN